MHQRAVRDCTRIGPRDGAAVQGQDPARARRRARGRGLKERAPGGAVDAPVLQGFIYAGPLPLDTRRLRQRHERARVEAARLWADLVARHHRLRRLNWRWPSKARFQTWAKGRYPGLSAQSTQQIIGEFVEAVDATRHLRKNGHDEACYPWNGGGR